MPRSQPEKPAKSDLGYLWIRGDETPARYSTISQHNFGIQYPIERYCHNTYCSRRFQARPA